MDKVRKQIILNVIIVVFSCLVIFIAHSIALRKIATFKDWVGADIVFTMITSLATTGVWRMVEKIEGSIVYNAILIMSLAIYSIVYGAAIADCDNKVVYTLILCGIMIFLILYVIENIIILRHFMKDNVKKAEVNITNYGYHYRKES